MEVFLQNQRLLRGHIRSRLLPQAGATRFTGNGNNDEKTTAAVLFLLGMHRPHGTDSREPCLILNQRSRLVPQPGDLCFPGGGLAPHLDAVLAGVLRLPGFPLHRWLAENRRHRIRSKIPRGMPRLLATSLREGFEEMRVSPLRVRFLGPMAPEYFNRFNRIVYPMVAWHTGTHAFSPNWEVERVVTVPLRRFLDPGAYGILPLSYLSRFDGRAETPPETMFPCLVYENSNGRELLWGLTFRIVMRFLEIVFDFKPPETAALPILPPV